jgi:hypothetical protein
MGMGRRGGMGVWEFEGRGVMGMGMGLEEGGGG